MMSTAIQASLDTTLLNRINVHRELYTINGHIASILSNRFGAAQAPSPPDNNNARALTMANALVAISGGNNE
jgi:hypothetical protein